MEAIILTKDQFNELISKINDISEKISASRSAKTETYLNNKQFMEMLGVSLRTAQSWRDEGKITFSQVGNKIYYKLSDVEKLLNEHYNKSFAKK